MLQARCTLGVQYVDDLSAVILDGSREQSKVWVCCFNVLLAHSEHGSEVQTNM